MQAKINIIVPALNEASRISACLTALQSARRGGCRLVVVDGGSEDETVACAEPLADVVLQSNPGRATQMNLGVDYCGEGDYWFVHADCVCPPTLWEAVAQSLSTMPNDWGRCDVRLSGDAWVFRVIERMINWRARLTGIATGDQAIFVRRRALNDIAGIPALEIMEDIALTRLLRRRSRPASVGIQVLTSSRRWEQHGIVRTIGLMWLMRIAYFFGASQATLARWYR